jgi:branched-chain amino acid transport system permease protein
VFTIVFSGGSALAGLAGVIGGNYLVTEPSMAITMGPIVFVVVVFGGLGSLAGCFIASLIMGLVQTFAVVLDVSFADLLARLGLPVTSATPLAEFLTIPLPRVGALLPYLMLILVLLVKPRGLMGTRDT